MVTDLLITHQTLQKMLAANKSVTFIYLVKNAYDWLAIAAQKSH